MESRRNALPNQVERDTMNWSHSTSSVAEMHLAMSSPVITAIETDIVVGRSSDDDIQQPIMAHPPNRCSDLTFARFLRMATSKDRKLLKDIKLDFKEQGVLPGCLEQLLRWDVVDSRDRTVYLNADLIPGPGKTPHDDMIPASAFFDFCDTLLQSKSEVRSSFLHMGKCGSRSLILQL